MSVRSEIERFMDFDTFVRLQERLNELKKEEETRLSTLADLQKAYLAAHSDQQREYVKGLVAEIREMSRASRLEIRSCKQELLAHMSWEQATELYHRLLSKAN